MMTLTSLQLTATLVTMAGGVAAAQHAAVLPAAQSAAPPPPSWQHTNCSSCVAADLLWCCEDVLYDDRYF